MQYDVHNLRNASMKICNITVIDKREKHQSRVNTGRKGRQKPTKETGALSREVGHPLSGRRKSTGSARAKVGD